MAKLYLVPTPIGNLEDITFRAVNILKTSDFILAEDTRTSGNLLKHYEISTRVQSYHQYNEHAVLQSVVNKIRASETVSLITDAGTPGISDPGFLLVRECIKNDIKVECLPGATAFVPALVCSGFSCEKFIFEGFLPHKKGRNSRLEQIKGHSYTFILYESPFRLYKTLEQLKEYLGGERQAAVAREISKIHEEYQRGSLSDLCEIYKDKAIKGEIVIIVEGKKDNTSITENDKEEEDNNL
ncbi:MAG: 16S rRNA (cytidine(1402)-2'-O)-methyltransferase [Bacteroidales bacterium]|jgi:16S rRNA (cytidine1402-2'-O)-methyltransferase|nr:16S rRNA (cytidine(1402)-2'-O)-methyltransferase [Bacteroidales bacterium]MDD2203966.1 16S rRNA (cytidine(1402)-2'-O)-methyltransferase [Bacteroidales bacterium]MDD3151911.1 16S rRNA (cytidine(1402)-2'-O)-methyltransferase [Bacteroidales bacterium]MDD3913445.1 16S rRNA (cytidine(1402)-2'-O)-methyltransferase [Bacteroidales bacterium]MDD4633241.1 16S rRNA (cytidine(1402)-2'-O)-methyltransferase [Bacteroidales bacterium]